MAGIKRSLGFRENVKLAFRGLFTHKLRSFLTMLGIIIGIAAIIAIVSIIRGTNEQLKKNLIGSGTNTVTINLTQGEGKMSFDYMSVPDGVGHVSEGTVDKIKDINHVTSVSLFNERMYADSIFHGNTSLSGGSVLGIDQNYLATAGLEITKGRYFTEHDYASFIKAVIIDQNAADTLFASEDPLGKTIEIRGEPFTVVGMAARSSKFEPVIETVNDYYMYSSDNTGHVYIPLSVWPVIYKFDEPESVIVGIDVTDAITSVGQKAAEVLNASISPADESVKYAAEDLLQQAEQLQNLSKSTNSMLLWIAAISLLVGGIGVMNIMLVSVMERTREIGLKKALGARRSTILFQFLTEAAVLTSIGGIIGILSGIGLAYLISFIAMVPVAISWVAIVIAFVFSAMVGIIFGLLPSIQASRLDPIDALRYE